MNNYNMYALIDDNGIVENVKPFKSPTEAKEAVNLLYLNGEAVCVNNYLVWEGDLYDKGSFKRRDEETGKWIPINIERTNEDDYLMAKDKMKYLHERISFLENKLKENNIEV